MHRVNEPSRDLTQKLAHKHVCNLKCIATSVAPVINGNGFFTYYSDNLLSCYTINKLYPVVLYVSAVLIKHPHRVSLLEEKIKHTVHGITIMLYNYGMYAQCIRYDGTVKSHFKSATST